jgi:hypothetical protein
MARRGTILPSLPPLPDDELITVCASCNNRCCIFFGGKRRCDARKADANFGTVERTVAQLRAVPQPEHHSYWRHEEGDDPDMPKCIEDVRDLSAQQRKEARAEPVIGFSFEERSRLHAGYLTYQLGLDMEQCRDILRDVWPEASAAIDAVLKEAS